MLNALLYPTPQQLFVMTIIYVVITMFLGYVLAGGFVAFMGLVGGLQLMGLAYKLSQEEKLRDKHESKKEWITYAMIPLAYVLYFGVYDGGFFRTDFVLNRIELSQTTGIVPKHGTRRDTGGGKSRRTYYYLTINGVNVHCSEDDYDDCDRIYVHNGKTATVYYQSGTKNGNLAYEIVVDNTPIYDFDSQLLEFQRKRKQENQKYLVVLFLYILPMFYFALAHRGAVEHLDEMDETEKVQHDTQQALSNVNAEPIRAKDYGMPLFVVYWFGMFCVVFAVIALIYWAFLESAIGFVMFLALAVAGGLCTYFPYKVAKANHRERVDLLRQELDERLVAINPDLPKIRQQEHEAKRRANLNNPNRAVFSQRVAQPQEHPQAWTPNQSGSQHQAPISMDSLPQTRRHHYKDDYDVPTEPISLGDVGWLNALVLVVALVMIVYNVVVFFDKGMEKHAWYYGFTAFYVLGSLVMIYKVYVSIITNRDIRVGLYDNNESDDDESDDGQSFLFWAFRLFMLAVLIPLFCLLSYWLLQTLIHLSPVQLLGVLFYMIVVGFFIKKLW